MTDFELGALFVALTIFFGLIGLVAWDAIVHPADPEERRRIRREIEDWHGRG